MGIRASQLREREDYQQLILDKRVSDSKEY